MADSVQVYVKGLAELRRDLRRTDREALKEVQAGTRDAAKIVAAAASAFAPRKTGTLAGGYRGTTSGNRGVVFSQVPYAGVVEWGGTIRPRGVPITFKPRSAVGQAMERNEDKIIDAIGDGIERAAARTGWH